MYPDFISQDLQKTPPSDTDKQKCFISHTISGKNKGTLSIKTTQGEYVFSWIHENNTLRIVSHSSIIRDYYIVWNKINIDAGLEELGTMIAEDITQEYETIFQRLRECYSGRVEKIMMFLEKNIEHTKSLASQTSISPLEKALEQIGTTFGPRQVDPSITEVSSLLPDTLDISIGVLDISKTYPEREVIVNGFRFRIWQETKNNGNFGGYIPVCKIQPIFERNTPFSLPDELEVIEDTKDMLNNRAGKINSWISNKEGIYIGNIVNISKWLQEIFLEYKTLSLGHTFSSLAQDTLLRRNYGFLVWVILHYNKTH